MRLLRVPGCGPLLAGQSINAIGNWVAIIAIWGFAAFRFDASAGDLALLFVVLSVPGALLGPLLGVPIDRLGPRRTLVLANVLGFLDALALTQADSYGTIILLALPLGLIEALAAASLDALPPRLFDDDDLVAANALLGGADDLAIVVGPILAAGVNLHWGLPGAFLVDAATFLVGAVVALRLDVTPLHQPAEVGRSAWREVREGAGLAWRIRGLRWTFALLGATYAIWGAFGVLEPLYVRDLLGEPDTTFALVQSVFGLGLVGAGLVLAAWGQGLARPATSPSPPSPRGSPLCYTWERLGSRSPFSACSSGAPAWLSSMPRPRPSCSVTPLSLPMGGSCPSTSHSNRPPPWCSPPSPPSPSSGGDVRLLGITAGAALASAGVVALLASRSPTGLLRRPGAPHLTSPRGNA